MRRGSKPAKAKVEAKPPVAHKSPKNEGAKVRDLEKRLAEALEQRAALSEILQVIRQSRTDVQPVFETILRSAKRLCDAVWGVIMRVDGDVIDVAALDIPSEGRADLRQRYPAPLSAPTGSAQAARERRIVQIVDVEADPTVTDARRRLARIVGYRSQLFVPILSGPEVFGVISVSRAEPGGFSPAEITLVQTFAAQAVIAIENVRLFNETKEALERQTATAEILRVISRSPTDVQPVFDIIAERAVKLCDAEVGIVSRYDGTVLREAALYGLNREGVDAVRRQYPMRLDIESTSARAFRGRAPVHVEDVMADPAYGTRDAAQAGRWRGGLGVPMLREGQGIGVIFVGRSTPGLFREQQVELLKTFADQAVIAIENVRLFNETKEALEQQTATSEILRVISSSPTDVQPVFDTILDNATRLCGAARGGLFLFDGDAFRVVSAKGATPASAEYHSRRVIRPGPHSALGRIVRERAPVHIPDLMDDLAYREGDPLRRAVVDLEGMRTLVMVPLLKGDRLVGAIGVHRREVAPFNDPQIELLQTFADQAVIAIENVRLFKELQEKNHALTRAHAQMGEALDQQTATAELLRVISRSQTDVQPVFDAIADSALRLLHAWTVIVCRFDGELIHLEALRGGPAGSERSSLGHFPTRPTTGLTVGRCILERSVIQIGDVETEADPVDATREMARARGWRSAVAVPMLRDRQPIGAIMVTRAEPGGFGASSVELLQTFAEQAVIAIENVRLFTELQARTQELTRSVEQLTALGEVGQAITSTLDLQTVLSTIVARATQLTGVDAGVIYEYDAEREVFEPRATERLEEDIVQMLEATPVRKGQGATGRLAEMPEPIQVPDVRDIATQIPARDALVRAGYRAVLAVPLVREDHLIGGLTVFRKTSGEFARRTVDLLRTFATQSALAIQNARLFQEIEEKSRELEAASRHKSEFLANMSHELRTPLNAIIGFSEVLSERMFGDLNEKQEEYLKDIYASGTHLLSLINDILDLSKIEAGRMELELTDFHLPQAIDNALILVRERAGRRGITLEHSVDERLGEIRGDERKVKQVLLNLLSNALKFTPEGGRVEVRAGMVDGMAEISVTDTGVGIAPEDQGAIFEEFRQVGTADKKAEGTGLGLTLCRKFVELHGGKIWVKSQLGGGSTFTFTIPVHRDG